MNNLDRLIAMPVTPAGSVPESPAGVRHPRNRAGRLYPRLRAAEWLAGRLPPFAANRLRTAALRAAGLQVGHGSIFWNVPTIIGSGDLGNLSIGIECGFNIGCFFELDAPIQIGNKVAVGHDVMILTASYSPGEGSQRAGAPYSAPVVIEDGVWIGARCVIMPGVTIGAGSVIGATAVIAKDVPPNSLIMGSQTISLARWR